MPLKDTTRSLTSRYLAEIRKNLRPGGRSRSESGTQLGETAGQPARGRSFLVSALHISATKEPHQQALMTPQKTPVNHRGRPTHNSPSRGVRELGTISKSACSEVPRHPGTLELDGSLKDPQCQEPNLYKASLPRSIEPQEPTSAETAGKIQKKGTRKSHRRKGNSRQKADRDNSRK